MVQLFWSILNIIFLLFFAYLFVGIIFQERKIFKGKFRSLSIAILILGVLHIVTANNSEESNHTINIYNDYNKENSTLIRTIILEDNLTMNIDLSILYSNNNETLIPVKATSTLSGLVSGYDWKIKSINISNKTKGEKKSFVVYGVLDWKLFGIKFYSQPKSFKGKI